ncbi:hypothetical protein LSAT2_005463 [Lamellibrachia satsuma]|nr:hypothetical protein LSAT2_005463 [Lamellibrachia satsuma]
MEDRGRREERGTGEGEEGERKRREREIKRGECEGKRKRWRERGEGGEEGKRRREIVAEKERQGQSGVPQGSVLGPVMFTLYTTPLQRIFKRHGIKYHKYADDIQLYASYNPATSGNQVKTLRRLENCIGEARRWMALRMLKLNDEKTKMMLFTSKHHLRMYGGCSLTIGDDTVSPSDHIRNLGVHMDQHLTMTDHVTAVCAACNYHLYRLSSIRHYLTTEAAKSAVNALVTSRLDYCNSLLHNIPLSQTARLQCVQNNAARLITCTSKHDHITPVLKELLWLPVESRIAFKMLMVAGADLRKLEEKVDSLQKMLTDKEETIGALLQKEKDLEKRMKEESRRAYAAEHRLTTAKENMREEFESLEQKLKKLEQAYHEKDDELYNMKVRVAEMDESVKCHRHRASLAERKLTSLGEIQVSQASEWRKGRLATISRIQGGSETYKFDHWDTLSEGGVRMHDSIGLFDGLAKKLRAGLNKIDGSGSKQMRVEDLVAHLQDETKRADSAEVQLHNAYV